MFAEINFYLSDQVPEVQGIQYIIHDDSPTGEKGNAQQLEPQADMDIIDELVKAASDSLGDLA